MPRAERQRVVRTVASPLSLRRRCALLGLARSSLYYRAREGQGPDAEDLVLMRLLDEQYLRTPFYGVRRLTHWLRGQGWTINPKRVRRLLRVMGLEAIYPRPRLSQPEAQGRRYPYLLRGMRIERPGQVWSADITYVPLGQGWLYLTAVVDWFSRYVLAWRLSNTLDGSFCVEAVAEALARHGRPAVFNTDQGAQFTSAAFTDALERAGIAISQDGRGRALDNVFVERLWRTVKYEEVYLKGYADGAAAYAGLGRYFRFYNEERLHQALGYRTPAVVQRGLGEAERAELLLQVRVG